MVSLATNQFQRDLSGGEDGGSGSGGSKSGSKKRSQHVRAAELRKATRPLRRRARQLGAGAAPAASIPLQAASQASAVATLPDRAGWVRPPSAVLAKDPRKTLFGSFVGCHVESRQFAAGFLPVRSCPSVVWGAWDWRASKDWWEVCKDRAVQAAVDPTEPAHGPYGHGGKAPRLSPEALRLRSGSYIVDSERTRIGDTRTSLAS